MNPRFINNFPVHPVGIGTWLMGSGLYPDKVTHYAVYGNEEKEIAAIQYSLKHGQNHIDTAMVYGLGHTEEIVGQAIKGFDRSKIFLASKLWKSHLRGEAVMKAIEGMLLRLQTSYLDLVYLHGYWAEYEPLEMQLNGLTTALDQGLIKAIGVSNFTLEQLKEAQRQSKHPISALQNYYSISNRTKTSPELLAFCRREGIAFIVAKPLERGLLLADPWNGILLPLADKYKKTSSQIALAWLLNHDHVHVIPKASTPEHIRENIDAADITLDKHDFDLLSTAHAV